MLKIYSSAANRRFCDGVSRRNFIRVGALSLGGLALPQLLRAEQESGVGRSHKAVIMIYLPGGPPHQDTFDLKLDAPSEIRGEFRSGDASEWRTAGQCDLPAIAEKKPRLSLQFYQGPPGVEHWARVTEFLIERKEITR